MASTFVADAVLRRSCGTGLRLGTVVRRLLSIALTLVAVAVQAQPAPAPESGGPAGHPSRPPLVVDQLGRVSDARQQPARSPENHGGAPPPAGERSLARRGLMPMAVAEPTAPLALQATTAKFGEKWRWVEPGYGVGAGGLVVADIDGDGSNDLLATGGYWGAAYAYVLHADGAGGYEERWVVPGSEYVFARVAQLDGDAALEVVVGNDLDIRVYDGATHALQTSLSTIALDLTGLEVGDVDHNGDFEVVVLDQSDLFVYDLTSGALQTQKLGFGGVALALGQADGDPQLEIGIATDTGAGMLLDGSSLAAQWGRPSGFGTLIALGDLDGDGLDEVATGYENQSNPAARVFDPSTDTELYHVITDYSLDHLAVGDVTGTSRPELVLGLWSGLSVRDGLTGALLWGTTFFGSYNSAIAVGDADADGMTEIVWGGNGTSIGSRALHAVDVVTHAQEWESLDLDGPFNALATADVDGNGRPEVIAGSVSGDGGYADGRYVFFAGDSGEQLFTSDPTTPNDANWTGIWDLAVANLDGDPQPEICVTSANYYTGRLICYDGQTHQEQWHVDLPDGLTYASLLIADVDGDGSLDVVAGTVKQHTGAPGTYVYAYHGGGPLAGLLLWRTPDLCGNCWADWAYVRLAEVDGDPQREVVAADWGDQIAVIRGESGLVDLVADQDGLTALATPDRNHDGIDEILVGTEAGTIQRLDPVDGTVAETVVSGYSSAVNGLAVADVNGDGADDYAFGNGSQLVVRSGAGPGTLFSSDSLGPDTGRWDSVIVAELDGDLAPEILVNTGNGIAVFDTPGAVLFVDDFENGLLPWSGKTP